MVERLNSDLANTLGNLVNRTISMSNKYFGGVVEDKGAAEAADEDLKAVATGVYDKVAAKMAELRVADALTEIFALFKRCNKYIDETEPWVLAKDEAKKDRLSTVLSSLSCLRRHRRLRRSLIAGLGALNRQRPLASTSQEIR